MLNTLSSCGGSSVPTELRIRCAARRPARPPPRCARRRGDTNDHLRSGPLFGPATGREHDRIDTVRSLRELALGLRRLEIDDPAAPGLSWSSSAYSGLRITPRPPSPRRRSRLASCWAIWPWAPTMRTSIRSSLWRVARQPAGRPGRCLVDDRPRGDTTRSRRLSVVNVRGAGADGPTLGVGEDRAHRGAVASSASPRAVPGAAQGRDGASVEGRAAQRTWTTAPSPVRPRPRALRLLDQVRVRVRWPSFWQGARPGPRGAHRGPLALHGAHRGALRPLRLAPRPRVRRRPEPHRTAYCMNSLALGFEPGTTTGARARQCSEHLRDESGPNCG